MKNKMIVENSSSIKSYEFDNETKTLTVEFKAGSIYTYQNISDDIARDFRVAESKGSYLAKNIKGKFDYSKVEGVPAKAAYWPFAPAMSDEDDAAWTECE
jgi:KTSC domain